MEYVAAKSTICRQCGRSFSPSASKPGVKAGDAVTPLGELPLHRKLEAIWSRQRNRECEDSMTLNLVGKIPGRIAAQNMIVERKADIHCFRRVRVTNIDIRGRMSGEIIATGSVTIGKGGTLEGNVTAKSIAIEKGGMFSGQLAIGQAGLTQGELLSESKAAGKKAEPEVPAGGAQPLHAT